MEAEYISSTCTLTGLCRKYKVTYTAAWKKKQELGWDKLRKQMERAKVEGAKTAVLKESARAAVEAFRTSEAIRLDVHRASNAVFKRVRDIFIDPRTGQPWMRPLRLTPRQMKDYVETIEKTFKLEMLSAGHELTPEVINHNSKIMVAGVSIEQIMQLPDDQLDKVLSVASKASDIGVSGGREASVEAEHSEDVSSEPKDGKV